MNKYTIGFGTKASETKEYQTKLFSTDKEACACVDKAVLFGVDGSLAHVILLDGSYYAAEKRDGVLFIEQDFYSVKNELCRNYTVTNIIGAAHL